MILFFSTLNVNQSSTHTHGNIFLTINLYTYTYLIFNNICIYIYDLFTSESGDAAKDAFGHANRWTVANIYTLKQIMSYIHIYL